MAKQPPETNGTETIAISIAPIVLDHTDAQHMQLARLLERDGHVMINVKGKVESTTRKTKRTDEGTIVNVSHRFVLEDATPAA